MFRNYLKTAFRFLRRNRTFSLINIAGLSLGTLCCLYIILYVREQYSYDRHHLHAADLYRVNTLFGGMGEQVRGATTSPPITPAMKRDFPEILQYARVISPEKFGIQQHLLRYKDQSYYEKKLVLADSTLFGVFSWHFVAGDAVNPLGEPNSAVLLKPVADKLFGKEDPIGKMITLDNEYGKKLFRVTAVIDESMGKSHIQANVILSMNSPGLGEYVLRDQRWAGDNFANSYIRLSPHADVAGLEKKLPAFLQKYGGDQLKEAGIVKTLQLQPVSSIHTTTGWVNELDTTVSGGLLTVLVLIAILIQVIACINFMNLSTARASRRAKEVGVRKVIGAGRAALMKQFLGESFLLALVGVCLALPLLYLLLPWLNRLTGAALPLHFFLDYRIWLMLAGLILGTGLVAGSYPAFYLSAFQAIRVLKGNFTNSISASGIRRALVLFQFVLSIGLIGGIIVIYQQMQYIRHKDLGFDKEQKLIFGFYTDETRAGQEHFMQDLRQLGDVKAVTKSSNYPSRFIMNDEGFTLPGGDQREATDVRFLLTDQYFAGAFGMKVLAGRDFHANDSNMVLVNQTLLRTMKIDPSKAVGKRLYAGPDYFVTIAGVLKDFNMNSLHEEIQPFMLRYAPNGQQGWGVTLNKVIVSTASNDYPALLRRIRAVWQQDLPGVPFDYSFLDEEVQQQYAGDITMSRIINSFTGMAILISCLGLFGLAAFSAEQRKREIGIRKVLGASVPGLVRLLSVDFLKLVGLAILIATPLAWWALQRWLQGFVYRIEIRWWMFALAGLAAIAVALLTVSSQAVKAALTNPVKSLKTE